MYISFHFDSSLFTLNDAVCIVERRTKSESDKSLNCHFHSLFTVYVYRSSCLVCVHFAFFHCWWWCSLKCDNFEWNLQFVRNVVGSMCLFLHSQNVTHQLNGCFVYRLNNAFFIASLHFIKIAWKHSAGTDGRQRETSRMVKKMRIFNRDREEIDALLN